MAGRRAATIAEMQEYLRTVARRIGASCADAGRPVTGAWAARMAIAGTELDGTIEVRRIADDVVVYVTTAQKVTLLGVASDIGLWDRFGPDSWANDIETPVIEPAGMEM